LKLLKTGKTKKKGKKAHTRVPTRTKDERFPIMNPLSSLPSPSCAPSLAVAFFCPGCGHFPALAFPGEEGAL
jgi:hypothetical protein